MLGTPALLLLTTKYISNCLTILFYILQNPTALCLVVNSIVSLSNIVSLLALLLAYNIKLRFPDFSPVKYFQAITSLL